MGFVRIVASYSSIFYQYFHHEICCWLYEFVVNLFTRFWFRISKIRVPVIPCFREIAVSSSIQLQHQLACKRFYRLTSSPHHVQGPSDSSTLRGGSDFPSTHIPSFSCQLAILFLGHGFFKILLWKSTVMFIAEGHKLGSIISTQFFSSISIGHRIPEIWPFRNLIIKF